MEELRSFEPYVLHVYDESYFSGKMQAYMAYKEIPHRSHDVSWRELASRVAPHTGLVEVPVVERADGVFLRDSTAMIEWFEERYTEGRVLPEDPAAAFFCRLLEDYADEGLWRPALYYRWAFDTDALLNARRFANEFLSFPLTPRFVTRRMVMRRQRRTYMSEEGITKENRADVEKHYHDELADLETVFRKRPFLFGGRPSLADFGYFASMFRHFGIDPTPSRIMREQAPAVVEWLGRMWNARASKLGGREWLSARGGLPADLEPLLARAARRFLPSLHGCARAIADGKSHFDVYFDGRLYPKLAASPFLAWRRSVLQQALADLPAASIDPVRDILARTGCLEWLERDGVLPHGYAAGELLPFSRKRTLSVLEKLKLQIIGTPHHLEAGTVTEG